MTLNFEIILKEISRNNLKSATFVTRVIWYRMYNFKNVKNSHGGVLLLVKLQAETCNFTKSNTPPWMFFTFFKLCIWYSIPQSVAYFCFPAFLSERLLKLPLIAIHFSLYQLQFQLQFQCQPCNTEPSKWSLTSKSIELWYYDTKVPDVGLIKFYFSISCFDELLNK